MTSEEIQNVKRGRRAIDGIWEVAYQLAVMNERTATVNPLRAMCECGHERGEHRTAQGSLGPLVICHAKDCDCAGFEAA
jgi:hypothetical protein